MVGANPSYIYICLVRWSLTVNGRNFCLVGASHCTRLCSLTGLCCSQVSSK
jgi:hypothetical protein